MPEIAPRITYSPDRILELHKTIDPDRATELEEHKELIDRLPHYSVSEDGDETVIQVEIVPALAASNELDFHNENVVNLIKNLYPFTYFDYEDKRDGVFSLDFWSEHGAEGVIFPQIQRWLNNVNLSEDLARDTVYAMAEVFGLEQIEEARKDFSYRTNGESAIGGLGGFSYGVTSAKDQYRINVQDEIDGEPKYRHGEVNWNNLSLSTIGSCACWGVSGEARDHLYISTNVVRLYEMQPHNVDLATQSLSLVLGAARLAFEAAKYEGTEDLYADVRWFDS